MRPTLIRVIAVLAVLASTAAAEDLAPALTLRDHLGHTWRDEVVSLEAGLYPPGHIRPEEVAVVDGAGAALPLQLSDVELHDDGSVARARVWTLITLPGATRSNWSTRPPDMRGAWHCV